jgi:hypothetical protein
MVELATVIDRDQLYQLSTDLRQLADLMIQANQRPPPEPAPPTASHVRSIIRARRLREKCLDDGIFADPAWDMLLDLFAARLEQRSVSVSSLCVAAAVPATTALRWIDLLHLKGHVIKLADPKDRRRVFVAITDSTAARMSSLLAMSEATILRLT